MTSRRDSNKTFKKIIGYVAIGALILFVWPFFKSLTLPLVESTGFFSSRVYTFFSKTIYGLHMHTASNEALYQENLRLENELNEEKLRYVELATLKDDIRKYEELSIDPTSLHIFAKRVGAIDTVLYDTFRINKGAQAGLHNGQLVVGKANVVVGMVAEAGDTMSLVNMFWNGNEVLGRTSASGTVITLMGVDDGVYQAKVPHEMNFAIGDVILYDANPNLILGVVRKINDNESDRFKEVLIHTPFHPKMIDVVRIYGAL